MKVIYIVICLFLRDPVVAYPKNAGIVDAKTIKAHQYHGIQVSIEDESGYYFIRNGQRCTLFTASFMRKYNKK